MILPLIITWTASNTSDVLYYMGGLIEDLTPLLVVIIAVGVGLIIVGAIIKAIRG